MSFEFRLIDSRCVQRGALSFDVSVNCSILCSKADRRSVHFPIRRQCQTASAATRAPDAMLSAVAGWLDSVWKELEGTY